MKKKTIFTIFAILAISIHIINRLFFSMSYIPEGKLISEVESPTGEYTIKAYISESSLSASAVRGELNYNKSNKSSQNIYWDYPQETANIEWIDEDTIVINGHRLDVLKDQFDFRRD